METEKVKETKRTERRGRKQRVRRADIRDMEAIERLLIQVNMVHHRGRPDLFRIGKKKYTGDQLEKILCDDNRPVFVAVDEEDRVLGYAFCVFRQHPDDNILTDIRTLYIDDLCVDEKVRGQHIGKFLFEQVRAFAAGAGCYNLTLNVWSLNESAIRFYEACGLKPQKITMETIL